jgi:hypothetical protein
VQERMVALQHAVEKDALLAVGRHDVRRLVALTSRYVSPRARLREASALTCASRRVVSVCVRPFTVRELVL